jgi:hypothetical protein
MSTRRMRRPITKAGSRSMVAYRAHCGGLNVAPLSPISTWRKGSDLVSFQGLNLNHGMAVASSQPSVRHFLPSTVSSCKHLHVE